MLNLIDPYIPSFLLGMLVAGIIYSEIHRHQAKAWQAEYRRLMGGIKQAFTDLYTLTSDDVVVIDQPKSADIGLQLQKLYQGLK